MDKYKYSMDELQNRLANIEQLLTTLCRRKMSWVEYDATSINMSSQPSATKSQQTSAWAHPSNQSVVKNIPPLNLNIDLPTNFQPQPHRINRPEDRAGNLMQMEEPYFASISTVPSIHVEQPAGNGQTTKREEEETEEVSMSNHFSNQAQQSTTTTKNPKCPPPPLRSRF
uniref:Uncharacterized protein n=1 Tax=Ditylenchus dipsaci TaxID=166011 RepID=A0A915D992_9BILA